MYALIPVVLIAILASIVIWRYVVHPVFLSPLASIPAAHPLAHITSLWIQLQRFRGVEYQCVTDALSTKGPHIRLGPYEVVVNDIDAVRAGWGVGSANFDKHASYKFFGTHGSPNTFTTLSSSEHRHRRHRLRKVYTRAFLLSSPHMRAILDTIIQHRLRPILARVAASSSRITNALPLSQAFVLDYVSAFALGLPLGHKFLDDAAALQHWSDLYNKSYPGGLTGYCLKEHGRIAKWLCSIGVPMLPRSYAEARRELEAWALQKVDNAEEILRQNHKISTPNVIPGDLPILYDAVRAGMAEQDGCKDGDVFTPSPTQRLELAAECLDHIASTSETFGTTFTYMLYELSRRPEVQRELRSELQAVENPFSDSTGLPDSKILENLPLLAAVIKESLRLRNTAPNNDPRVSPVHSIARFGRISNLPPRTRVGTYGWWLNRNPDIYQDPNSWAPERWIAEKSKSVDAASLNKWIFAFSTGSRGCIGQPIAMELMRMGLAAIYTSYETSIADESEYPGANQCMSGDRSERLMIRFDKLTV